MMLSLLEELCRRDVRPKMWRPPAFECGDPSETGSGSGRLDGAIPPQRARGLDGALGLI